MPLEVLNANVRKVAIEMLRYLPNTISLVLTFYIIFLVMFFGIQAVGNPASASDDIRFLIVSNAFWFLLLLGIIGLGFIAGGLAVVFKQVDALLQIMQFVFLGLAFVPLASATWLEFAPVVKGIDLMRNVMVSNLTLAEVTAADWTSLLLNGAVYFALGLGVFLLCERRALNRGLLGQY